MATEKQTKSVETGKQKYKRRRYNDMYISREVIMSKAFKKLTATALRTYLFFLTKRVMKTFAGSKQKRSGKGKYYIENQGEIEFTYREAEQRYGISSSSFKRAISQLVKLGLVDIVVSGYGLKRGKTLFGISERWQDYDTPDFVKKQRPPRIQKLGSKKVGFQPNNTYAKEFFNKCL